MKLTEKLVAIGIAVVIALQVLLLAGKGKDQPKEVDKTTAVTDAKVTKKKTTTVVTKKPDGTTSTETSVTETNGATKTTKGETRKVAATERKNAINALVGVDIGKAFVPVYGVSYTREVLGPVTLGAYGLTNGTIGVSIGVNF